MTSEPTRYDSTRETWENIWDGASVEIELEAVASARSMETIHKYISFLPKDKPIIEAGSGLSAVVITLRQMGYLVYFVSETGEEISFIRKDNLSEKM